YMASANSISHRPGGLYCLYSLHETQPFKPPFRIYLSPWQLKRLKELVAHAKEKNIELVYRFVNNMIDRKLFLYGASEFNEGYIEEEASELINVENACAQRPNKRSCSDTEIECYNQETVYQKTGLNERQMRENQSQNINENIDFNETSVNGDDNDSQGFNDLLQLLGSCNGLLCIVTDWITPFLYNPSTRIYKMLPHSGFVVGVRFTFGFDESNDVYKVVGIYGSKAKMYSLKLGRWKDINDVPHIPNPWCIVVKIKVAYSPLLDEDKKEKKELLGKEMELMPVTYVGIEARYDLELSITYQNIISIFTYIAMVVGALTWGFVADR
nr:small nuclear RNA activating complex (SNAPc), subunit SNAP43 protein [Tanacetum cinerariifolium]